MKWLLIGVVLAAAGLVLWLLRRRQFAVATRVARQADQVLRDWRASGDHQALLTGLSQTLRRGAIAVSGRAETAGLVGAPWREFLNAPLPDRPFDDAPGALLLDAAYRPETPTVDAADAQALTALCRRWAVAATRRSGP